MIKERVLCKCHRQPVRTQVVKGKPFNKKKYSCDVTGRQLLSNEFIYEEMKINLPNPDDTRDGSEIQCPDDLEEALEDFKKKVSGE